MASFKVTRYAAGRLSTPRKAPEVYRVIVTKGVQKFQVKKDRKWFTVCTVPDGEKGRVNLTHHWGTVLGRKLGTDFRFVVHKK